MGLNLKYILYLQNKNGSVAQLDNAPRYGRGDLGFESLQSHKIY